MTAKHYGIVDEIAQHEPDGVTGNLSVSAVLADSVHAPAQLLAEQLVERSAAAAARSDEFSAALKRGREKGVN